jgi:hypothetical protein
VEEELRVNNSDVPRRLALRREKSRRVVERIARVMLRVKTKRAPLPQSPLGKAIDYAQKQWPGLIAYLEDGRVEIDNNLCYAARGIAPIMPPGDLCRVAA